MVKSIFSCSAKSAIASISVALISTHVANLEMPPFPGAQYIFVTFGDCAIFHTNVCSRPPEPTTKTFIFSLRFRY